MTRDRLKPDTLYWVNADSLYFYCPDGVAGYWYESEEEVFDAGLTGYPVTHIDSLRDY